MRDAMNKLYNLGIKHVFESFEEELEYWSDNVCKRNAQYLINKVKELYKENLDVIQS